MADLRSDSCGQIILVTGFVLAVMFVALALVMNSVIFTENLATRSEAAKASDAIKVANDVEAGTVAILEYVNEEVSAPGEDYDTLNVRATRGVDNVSALSRRTQALNSRAVNVSMVKTHNGTWANQSAEERNFTSAGGLKEWRVVEDSEGIRDYRIHVTDPSTLEDVDGTNLGTAENFTVIANPSGSAWEMSVYNDTGLALPGNYVVEVTDGNGDRHTCTVPNSETEFWINVSAGTVDGDDCGGFPPDRSAGTVERVEYKESHQVFGTYRLMANATQSDMPAGNYNTTASDGPPIIQKSIYGVAVRVEYEEERIVYGTTSRVVPGETHD